MRNKYLNVPKEDERQVRALGARRDPVRKKWYVPDHIDRLRFEKWIPFLSIELVPESCWYANLRSNLSPDVWEILKKRTSHKAGYVCEVCGGKGTNWPVECHEIWSYDDQLHIQKLQGLIALCPPCHEVKHMGYANTQGRGEIAMQHLATVNHWTTQRTNEYILNCFEIWQRRSLHPWTLDITWLESLGIYPQNIDRDPRKTSYSARP
jgi:Domain of unknown function (DUF5710)